MNRFHHRGRFSSRANADLITGVSASNRTGARTPSLKEHNLLTATGRSTTGTKITPAQRMKNAEARKVDRTPLNPALQEMLHALGGAKAEAMLKAVPQGDRIHPRTAAKARARGRSNT